MEFVPYHQADPSRCVVVDGQLAGAFPLSHWRGSNIHKPLEDDTSAAIVLNAILKNIPQIRFPQVTANHYDIDGLVGIWSLLNLQKALQHDILLRQIALVGDFREVEPENPLSMLALKIVLTLNHLEKKQFYPPFGEKQEAEACVQKFQTFIPLLSEVIEDVEQFQDAWEEDLKTIMHGLGIARKAKVIHHASIRLTEIILDEPVPYYAYTWLAKDADIILSVYPNNRYELEYRYTTWVDAAKRKIFPRMHLQPLVEILNEQETSPYRWMAEDIMDSGPILRLGNVDLSRTERFDDPNKRIIFSSSIRPKDFTKLITDYFKTCYATLVPSRYTDWKQVKEIANLYFYAKNN
ncbi:MAG: hypothetical protein N2167_01085 [Flavobacteriales bacterium]|nr:hypothetical protein [Flavobacteriales bacterium]